MAIDSRNSDTDIGAEDFHLDELAENDQAVSEGEDTQLQITLSRSLKRKLINKARLEGISVAELVTELISEGVVLRAWEIVEKKSQLRQANTSMNNTNRPQNRNGFRPNNNNRGGRQNQSSGHSYRKGSYSNILDDNANFLEYVRNQEKTQR